LHFDAPSAAACSRCGRFSCQSCLVEREPAICSTCGPGVVDPYGMKRAFEFVPTFFIAFKLVLAELPKLLPIVIMFSIPAALIQTALTSNGDDLRSVSSSVRLSTFYEGFVGIIGAQAMLALLIARGEGRSLSLGAALNEGMQNWTRAIGVRIRSGLTILGFTLLLIIPGFWKATMLMFTSIAVLRSQEGDALETSESLVRGRFGLCFAFALVVLGLVFVPMVIIETVLALVAEELKAPRFPVELMSDVFDRFLGDVVMTALFYVAYVSLHRTAGLELAPMRWRSTPPLAERNVNEAR
jgi:hypothetical protein